VRRFLPFWIIPLALGSLLIRPLPANGQAESRAFLNQFDASRFPQLSVFLSLSDSLGGRPPGLAAGDLQLQEDGKDVRAFTLSEEPTGLRLIVILDPGPDLTRLLPEGDSRIARLQSTLSTWLGGLPQPGLDDFTLIAPAGALLSHSSSMTDFLGALNGYKPVVPAAPALSMMLTQALEAAADPLPRPGMRSIVLVFSATETALSSELPPQVCPRAQELNTPVFGIWSGRVQPATRTAYDALGSLATACGGYGVALENSSGLATLLQNLATQRSQYHLEYRSAAAGAANHNLQVSVSKGDYSIQTPPIAFSLDVQPPAVRWTKFPDTIRREGSDPLAPLNTFKPDSAVFEAETTFPDGHPREISWMQLLADDQPVWTCSSAPCGAVRWDISGVDASGTHTVVLAVRDELGLEGRTEARELAIDVAEPNGWDVFRTRYLAPVSIVLALVLAGGLMGSAVAILNRGGIRERRARSIAPEFIFPAGGKAVQSRRSIRNARVREESRGGEPAALAAYLLLEPLDPAHSPIAISAGDVILGRTADQAAFAVDDPSVSERHARIVRMPDGAPWVFDLGSTAGTWLNFEETPESGCALREGDRLNLGRAAYRVHWTSAPGEGGHA
jgi:hypothetical protein